MLLSLSSSEFQKITLSHEAVAVTAGATITPAQNAFGSYATILAGASVTDDVYAMEIQVCGIGVAASGKDSLLTIGIDPAGGTSFTDLIPNLVVSGASFNMDGNDVGAVGYWFPIFIKAGASIGGKGSVNNATVGTQRVSIKLHSWPKYPHLIRVGGFVTSIGIVAASSRGTTVVPGSTGAEGTWTSLGTPTLAHWFWQLGMGVNDSTMSAEVLYADLAYGDSGTKIPIIQNLRYTVDASEMVANMISPLCEREVPANVEIFGRLSCNQAPNSNYSMSAYGLGGV
jgi:hypothetical protein